MLGFSPGHFYSLNFVLTVFQCRSYNDTGIVYFAGVEKAERI